MLTCLRTRMGDFSPRTAPLARANGSVAFFAEPFFFAPSAAAVALPLRARSATWQSVAGGRGMMSTPREMYMCVYVCVCVCVSGG